MSCNGSAMVKACGQEPILGTGKVNRSDEFSEKFRKGGGVIFNPKIYIAKFGPLNRAFSA